MIKDNVNLLSGWLNSEGVVCSRNYEQFTLTQTATIQPQLKTANNVYFHIVSTFTPINDIYKNAYNSFVQKTNSSIIVLTPENINNIIKSKLKKEEFERHYNIEL